ncbi:MAG: hypothetical protein ABIP06_02575 [Pyrinomonadaceae bacterium]
MENNEGQSICGGRGGGSCVWVRSLGPLSCVSGDASTCNEVNILEAEESDFHDCNLIDATAAIKEILAKIPADPNGRSLSFLHTNMGTLLAWVEHGGEPGEGAVTAEDDDATVAAALKLKL